MQERELKRHVMNIMDWMNEYPNMWNEIYSCDNSMEIERMYDIIESLEKYSLYILIPAVICKKLLCKVNNAVNRFAVKCMLRVLETEAECKIYNMFKESIASVCKGTHASQGKLSAFRSCICLPYDPRHLYVCALNGKKFFLVRPESFNGR